MFTFIWFGANYTYVKSLLLISATDVTILFSTSNIFVFILSLIFLKDKFYLTKVIFLVIIYFYSYYLLLLHVVQFLYIYIPKKCHLIINLELLWQC